MNDLHFAKQSDNTYEVSTYFGEILGWIKFDLRGWYFLPKKTDLHYSRPVLDRISNYMFDLDLMKK